MTEHHIEAVTFDFWNTLVWEPPGQLVAGRMRAWAALLNEAGLAVDPARIEAAHAEAFAEYQAAWKANTQYVVADAADRMLAELGLEVDEDLRSALTRSFGEAGAATELQPADGLADCLRALQRAGVGRGIVCDIGLTPSSTLLDRLDRWGLLDLFEAWAFSDEVGVYKPEPAIFGVALAALGVEPGRAAHVGDRFRTDVAGARAMGMVSVRYTGFYDDPDQGVAEADLVIGHLSDLPAALGGAGERNPSTHQAMEPLGAAARRAARRGQAIVRRLASPLPRAGFADHRVSAPLVERLSDEELDRLNHLLPWSCFTVDGTGRRFGNAAWTGKREEPQIIPDRRIVLMDERFGLAGSHVLEIGCFEGIHTIALCQRALRVTAVDARLENVVKTIVRCSLHGCHPDVFTCDVEAATAAGELTALQADYVHHVGVLYHLRDPVSHVRTLGAVAGKGLLLDTHVAPPGRATEEVVVDGETFRYMRYAEGGKAEVFSGMYDHAKWLPLDTLVQLLHDAGFPSVELVEERAERNGPRVLILAAR